MRLVLDGYQQDSPVLEQGHVKDLQVRGDMFAALAEGEVDANVRTVMREDFPVAGPDEERFQETEAATVPFIENGRLS